MEGVNKVILLGAVGSDPDVRYTSEGQVVSNWAIATNKKWIDKSTGEKKEKTTWINCAAFGKLAEIVEKYVRKGSKLYCEGELTIEKYNDKNTGMEKTAIRVIVSNVQLLGDRPDRAETPRKHDHARDASNDAPKKDLNDFEGDIPF